MQVRVVVFLQSDLVPLLKGCIGMLSIKQVIAAFIVDLKVRDVNFVHHALLAGSSLNLFKKS